MHIKVKGNSIRAATNSYYQNKLDKLLGSSGACIKTYTTSRNAACLQEDNHYQDTIAMILHNAPVVLPVRSLWQ